MHYWVESTWRWTKTVRESGNERDAYRGTESMAPIRKTPDGGDAE